MLIALILQIVGLLALSATLCVWFGWPAAVALLGAASFAAGLEREIRGP